MSDVAYAAAVVAYAWLDALRRALARVASNGHGEGPAGAARGSARRSPARVSAVPSCAAAGPDSAFPRARGRTVATTRRSPAA